MNKRTVLGDGSGVPGDVGAGNTTGKSLSGRRVSTVGRASAVTGAVVGESRNLSDRNGRERRKSNKRPGEHVCYVREPKSKTLL